MTEQLQPRVKAAMSTDLNVVSRFRTCEEMAAFNAAYSHALVLLVPRKIRKSSSSQNKRFF